MGRFVGNWHMGKAPLILQYLHDHARLICDRRNEKDGPGTWRITPITDDQRHNIIFHYGTSENYQEFFSNKPVYIEPEKTSDSPKLNYCEINLKGLERREMTRMAGKKTTTKQSRITLKRGPTNGIFSNGIHANLNSIDHNNRNVSRVFDVPDPSPSTSSIYLASLPVSEGTSDYEKDIFKSPDDFEMAQYQHECDLERCDDNWFDETVNFTQSQRQGGFTQRHGDYYHYFNSQK